jgi:hypothetical protein
MIDINVTLNTSTRLINTAKDKTQQGSPNRIPPNSKRYDSPRSIDSDERARQKYDANGTKPREIKFCDVPYEIADKAFNNIDSNDIAGQGRETTGTDSLEITFCDVPYEIAVPGLGSPKNNAMEEFYQKQRLLLPAGLRSIFRAKKSEETKLSMKTVKSQLSISSYRDELNAIKNFNSWFRYTEMFHQCRVEYNITHLTIDMLSRQALDINTLNELLVVLYGQKYMKKAPSLKANFEEFLADFQMTFQRHEELVWIDLQCLHEAFGQTSTDMYKITNISPSEGSLRTIHKSNMTFTPEPEKNPEPEKILPVKKKRMVQSTLIEL